MDSNSSRAAAALDASSFFLVESTGDSEVDYDPNMPLMDLADGDAESCCCDVSDQYSCVTDFNAGCEAQARTKNVACEDEEEEEEEGHTVQTWHGGDIGLPVDQKSCVSLDSINGSPNDQMEKNRLFWEACLAS